MKRSFKTALLAAASLPVAMIASPAFAADDAATTGVTAGFAKIQAIVDLAVPLMIGLAAIIVAAAMGVKMLRKA